VSEATLAPKVNITLPDGKVLTFARGVTGAEIAAAIGPGLAKAALIVEINGKQWDLFRPIEADAKLRVITRKDAEALELIRHDTAHVLAMAVQELFPGTQVTIGPAIEDEQNLHAESAGQMRQQLVEALFVRVMFHEMSSRLQHSIPIWKRIRPD